MTKCELVERLGLEKQGSVDYALPQEWLNWAVDKLKSNGYAYTEDLYYKVLGQFVTFYPNEGKGSCFGELYPLTPEAAKMKFILEKH
jgi:hypothetical protein